MLIPDETSYKEGIKKVQKVRGFQLCTHCWNCPLTTQNQIHYDGEWFCMAYRKWMAGNDILEYLCRGYKLKSCATCKQYEICPERDKGTFCNRYRRKGVRVASLYRGRIRKVGLSSSLDAIEAEQVYIDKKLKAAKDSLSDNEDDYNM